MDILSRSLPNLLHNLNKLPSRATENIIPCQQAMFAYLLSENLNSDASNLNSLNVYQTFVHCHNFHPPPLQTF